MRSSSGAMVQEAEWVPSEGEREGEDKDAGIDDSSGAGYLEKFAGGPVIISLTSEMNGEHYG